jgi:N-acetylneuraminic acid mutarotase
MKIRNSKNWCILFSVITVIGITGGCKDDTEEISMGNWTRMSDFDGLPRSDAFSFSIGGTGYVGTGYDGSDRLKDFWGYNSEKDYWVQKADFPGTARNGATAFSSESLGFAGLGFDGDNKLNDFYQYNPSTNVWTKKADFAGTARYGAIGFCIGNKGYIGTGTDGNNQKDFYEYDINSGVWTKIISIGGQKRKDASCFVLNGKGYVISGWDNGAYLTDLYMFNPSTGEWTKMRDITNKSDEKYDDDYTNIPRISAVAFSVNNKGYLTLGSSSSLLSTTWEYDPGTDLWKELTEFEATIRTEAVGFGIGNYGYVTTGRSSSMFMDDIWRFNPVEEYDAEN